MIQAARLGQSVFYPRRTGYAGVRHKGIVVPIQVNSEALAYWYLRLNGFLTTTNFIVHPDQGGNQETDADVLGVRFPYRAENLTRPMKDHKTILGEPGKAHIVIAEVKSGRCALNGPWTNPHRKNMVRVLRAIGMFQTKEADEAARLIYETGSYSNQRYNVSIVCFGREVSEEVGERYPNVRQIIWAETLAFIYSRFREYRRQKASHPQWDNTGHDLWQASETSATEAAFLDRIQVQ